MRERWVNLVLSLQSQSPPAPRLRLFRLLNGTRAKVLAYISRQIPRDLRHLLDPEDIFQGVCCRASGQMGGTAIPDDPDASVRWIMTVARHFLVDRVRELRGKSVGADYSLESRSARGPSSRRCRIWPSIPARPALRQPPMSCFSWWARPSAGSRRHQQSAVRLQYIEGLSLAEAAIKMRRTEAQSESSLNGDWLSCGQICELPRCPSDRGRGAPVEESGKQAQEARAIAAAVIERREAGEALPDAQVLIAHRDLLPELAEELEPAGQIRLGLLAGEKGSMKVDPILSWDALNQPIDVETREQDASADVLDDKPRISGYAILEEIGRGGQGSVYRALQESTDRIVAIKVMAARAGSRHRIRIAARGQAPGEPAASGNSQDHRPRPDVERHALPGHGVHRGPAVR